MPYVLLLFGSILFVSGVRGTEKCLWSTVEGEFTGENSFLVWIAAIGIVGGTGYVPKLKPLSIAFMSLLLIVLALKNNGVFSQLQAFAENPGGSSGQTSSNPASGATTTTIQPLAALPTLGNSASTGSPVTLDLPAGLLD